MAALVVAGTIAHRAGAARARGKEQSARILSQTYLVDRKYRSMTGPMSTQAVRLLEADQPELLWITGYRALVVSEDGESQISQEFMCHSNLDLDFDHHRELFGLSRISQNRMFTISQGQQENSFPRGFGIPILSNESLDLTTQVLNHNLEHPSLRVRHRVTVDFIRDRDLDEPMKPLFQVTANAMVLLEGKDGYFNVDAADPAVHGPSCVPGQLATPSGRVITDPFGRRFAAHWAVHPGRDVNRTNVTRFMQLPFDTTVHYIAVHLHPFAKSLELRDLTANRRIFLSRARPTKGRIGLEHVDSFSSEKGIALYKDHEYELTSIYENPTSEDQDSMAVMYMYVADKEWKRPKL